MTEITNIESLRAHAIETLKKLRVRSIDIEEAKTTSNLYENIISTLKCEIEYNKFMKIENSIPFLVGNDEKEIKHPKTKRLIQSAREFEDRNS